MKTFALQTVGSHSQSIKDKNMVRFNDKPLFLYNSTSSKNCKDITKSFVITDYKDIFEYIDILDNRIEVIKEDRSQYNSNDSHYECIMQGLKHIENYYGTFDALVILLGNNVYATSEDLSSAIKQFADTYGNCDSLMSVSKFNQFNPYRAFNIANGFARNVFKSLSTKRGYKHANGDWYFFNGTFWIVKPQVLKDNNGSQVFSFLGDRILPFVQEEGVQEVDSTWQIQTLFTKR